VLCSLQSLARAFQPFLNWAQKRYQASVAERLKDYGLRYDDLYDPLMDLVSRGTLGEALYAYVEHTIVWPFRLLGRGTAFMNCSN
jgi:hypothetical protein